MSQEFPSTLPPAILIMGVCGSGKSTIGKALAESLDIPFLDADDFHPAANRQKMAAGLPLTDEDRAPWLAAIAQCISQPAPFALACSALRSSYRDVLITARPDLRVIFLHVPKEILLQRLNQRPGHFMPASLLDSQLAILEAPTDAIIIDATQAVSHCINEIRIKLTH